MSPEIASGSEYNASADVYSFAFLAWEMAAGVLPFSGSKPDWFEREAFDLFFQIPRAPRGAGAGRARRWHNKALLSKPIEQPCGW